MKKILKGILIFVLILILIACILIGVGYYYLKSKIDKIEYVEVTPEEIEVNEGVTEQLTGYRNIALLGIDSRQDDYGTGNRSDCIIIASINNDTKEVKLVSVYRDSYLKIKGSLDKVTHAYSYGGAALTLSTLNTNLDLDITEFVTVNFNAVVDLVDSVGGVEIEIQEDELQYINGYIDDTSKHTGVTSEHITTSGTKNLDGVQAVAYSRIRYTSGGDYKRTERMRTVVEAVVKKAKNKSISELINIINIMLPKVSTNINSEEIIKLLPQLVSYEIVDSIGWPYEVKGITLDRWYGVPVTLEENVSKLHETLFGEIGYVPSDTVKSISQSIINKTGYR